ncbi:MAG: hypothetical protein ACK5CC_09670, partial [Bacteroidota bacterium]
GEVKGSAAGGDIVDVYYFNGKLAGRGYFNPLSQIQVRLLSRKQEPIDAAFFRPEFGKHGNTERSLAIPKTAVWYLVKQMTCRL